MQIAKARLFLFDVDGVLYAGKERLRLIGGPRVFDKLRKLERRLFVVTNTSTHDRATVHRNLQTLGFELRLDEILTSIQLTAEYLSRKFGAVRCYLIGEEGFRRELETRGHVITEKNPQFVVVGLDRFLTYEKLNAATMFLRHGASLVASHRSRVYMYENGPAMAVGPIARALEYASGKRAVYVGKPSPIMFNLAMSLGKASPRETVMVGDQIESDIVGAKRVGAYAVLVLSGVERRETLGSSRVKPDLVLENVDQLLQYL